MLLAIDETKIAELLRSSANRLETFTSESCGVSGAVYAAPVLVTAESRNHILSARRRIEESGVPLKSAETLAREIEEMRSRG